MVLKVVVIGGGVIGFSTAYVLKKRYPNVDVTLLAELFSPDTCSDIAAGIWEPFVLAETPMELQRKWSKATWDRAKELSRESYAHEIGISTCSGYNLFDIEIDQLPEWHDLVPDMKKLTKKDLQLKNFPEKYQSGFFFTTLMIESHGYLPWLQKCFCKLGGKIEKKYIESFEEVAEYDLVINCTGFGARKLCNDMSITPVRGQVMRVQAPWVRHFYLCDLSKENKVAYIIPNNKWLVLGGTVQVGNFNTNVTQADKDHIIKETGLIQPDLKNCVHLKDAVGLRPSRPCVRLEFELTSLKNKTLKIIHNYGHGGAGLTIHWGCAMDAADLAYQHLIKNHLNKAKL
eukprot:gene291-917_t